MELGLLALISAGRYLAFVARMSIVPFYPELMAAYDVSYMGAGGLFSAFFVGYALSMVPAGIAADRWPPLRQLVIGLALLAGSGATVAIAGSYSLAIAARVIEGAAVAIVFTAILKLLATRFTRANRGRAVGTMEISTGLGFLTALTLFPLLAHWVSYRVLLLTLPVMALVAIALVRGARGGHDGGAKRTQPLPPLRSVMGRDLFWVTTTSLIGLFAANGMLGWLPTHLTAGLGFSKAEAGLITGVLLTGQLLGVYPAGSLSDRLGRRLPVIYIGTVTLALGFVGLALVRGGPLLYVVAAMLGLAFSWAVTPLMMLTTEMFGPERAGIVSALTIAVGQAGSGMAGLVYGWILDRTGTFTVVWAVSAALVAVRLLTIAAIREERGSDAGTTVSAASPTSPADPAQPSGR